MPQVGDWKVEDIARESGLHVDVVRRVFDAVLDGLVGGRIVAVSGFGRFAPMVSPRRRFKTPILGDVTQYGRRYVGFRQAARASKAMNREE